MRKRNILALIGLPVTILVFGVGWLAYWVFGTEKPRKQKKTSGEVN